MQGSRLDFGCVGAKLVSDTLENDAKVNFQHNKLATYFQKKSGKEWPPVHHLSGGLHCQQKDYQKYDN